MKTKWHNNWFAPNPRFSVQTGMSGAFAICVRIVLLLLLSIPGVALAQNGMPDDASEQLKQYSDTLDQIERAVQLDRTTDDELAERRSQALWIAVQARELALKIDGEAARVRERVAQLAPAAVSQDSEQTPGAGGASENESGADSTAPTIQDTTPTAPDRSTSEPDPAPEVSATDVEVGEASEPDVQSQVANTSAALESRLAQLTAMIRQANDIEVRAEQLAADANNVIRSRFDERVFKRHASILSPQLWQTFFVEFKDGLTRTEIAVNLVTKAALSRGALFLIPLSIFLLMLGFLHVPVARERTASWICRASRQKSPTETGIAVVGLVSAVVMTALPLIGLWIVFNLISLLGLGSIPLKAMEPAIVSAVVLVASSHALTLAVLSPERPAWRIAPISSDAAKRFSFGFQVPAQIVAIGLIIQGIGRVTDHPNSMQMVSAGLLSLTTAISVLILLRDVRQHPSTNEGPETLQDEQLSGQSLVRLIGLLSSLTAVVIIAACLAGFLPLAWFLTRQLVWTVLVAAAGFLVAYCLDAVSTKHFSRDSRSTAKLATISGLSIGVIAQIAILLTGLLKLLVGLVVIIAIAVPWGLNSASFVDQIEAFFTGFNIGDLRISIVDIVAALVILMAGIALTRVFQSWLTRRYLPNTKLDDGLKNSLTTATGYVGLIIAVVVAFSTIGIDLSRLALVAGALSVGIGFGLQSIVNNFVSGLILLAERPIKAGDWIEVAGEQGTVKHISVRSTELETFDRATVLIPNSDLISGTVKNMVFGNRLGRVSVLVGISYDSDADKARDILFDIGKNHELVLSYPEPKVFFLAFGESSLDMRLDVFLSDISKKLIVHSELNFEVLRAFREADIEIPFPQRDINIRATDEAKELLQPASQRSTAAHPTKDREGGDEEATTTKSTSTTAATDGDSAS